MSTLKVPNPVQVEGGIACTGPITAPNADLTNASMADNMALVRTKLAQDTFQPVVIPLTDLRVHDAITSLLPASAASDDLGLDTGTFGTTAAAVKTGDLKAAGSTTRYARFLLPIPIEYDDGQTVQVRINAGMLTTVADTAATVDVQAYRNGAGSDICSTSAQSANSLTAADLDFTITETNIVSGDIIDIRVAFLVNDGATGTVVQGVINSITARLDVRG